MLLFLLASFVNSVVIYYFLHFFQWHSKMLINLILLNSGFCNLAVHLTLCVRVHACGKSEEVGGGIDKFVKVSLLLLFHHEPSGFHRVMYGHTKSLAIERPIYYPGIFLGQPGLKLWVAEHVKCREFPERVIIPWESNHHPPSSLHTLLSFKVEWISST